VRECKPEIIHTHTFKAGLIGRLVRGKHKHIHTFHGHLFEDNSFSALAKKIITLVEQRLAPRTDVLVSVGVSVGKELREARIGVGQKWVSIAPGVEPLALSDKSEARKSMGINDSGILIGWMARMASVKNPNLLLQVASRLPDVQFVMAGGGDFLVNIKSNAPGNVKVIGWANAATFWSAVDIAISTSDNEGMPIALIEAQLAGVPVIATNVGSNNEVIEDEVTGFLASNSVDSLVCAINRLISLPDLIQTQGNNGRRRASKEFSLEKMIQSHVNLYREVGI
jgi:glycosyltransferase involved in cell wall biosynthesis